MLEADKRPVAAVADHFESATSCTCFTIDHSTGLELLHDPGHSMEERILREQFRQ